MKRHPRGNVGVGRCRVHGSGSSEQRPAIGLIPVPTGLGGGASGRLTGTTAWPTLKDRYSTASAGTAGRSAITSNYRPIAVGHEFVGDRLVDVEQVRVAHIANLARRHAFNSRKRARSSPCVSSNSDTRRSSGRKRRSLITPATRVGWLPGVGCSAVVERRATTAQTRLHRSSGDGEQRIWRIDGTLN